MKKTSKKLLFDGTNHFQSQTIESNKNAAIISSIQMLAHDVRKPFSLLKLALNILSKTNDPAQIHAIIKNISPEINRSINKVNGMLTEVMEMGTNLDCLHLKPINPEFVIKNAITECFLNFQKTEIHFSYNFSHEHMIKINPLKIDRVFFNILTNAVEAMNFKGNIWFQTKEVSNSKGAFIEFSIGNDYSHLSEEDLQNIFKKFFTKNKKNGTGLGLAIVKKMIKTHGGNVWCTSEKNLEFPNGKVEFWFTLPIAKNNLKKSEVYLPQHSSEINFN